MGAKPVTFSLREEEFRMAATAGIMVLVDHNGRVIAAELSRTVKAAKDTVLSIRIRTTPGTRLERTEHPYTF